MRFRRFVDGVGRDVRGHGTALAVDMIAACFADVEVARYRALVTNAPSLAVAARLGFEGYGENVAIRLASS